MSRLNNTFRFTGNVGVEPSIRNLTNGRVAEIALAVDASYRDRETKERVERVEWIDVTAYNPGLVDVIERFVAKGREITVQGTVRKSKWESKDRRDADGKPLIDSRYEFIVSELKFHGKPNKAGEGAEGESYSESEERETAEA